MGTPDRPVSRGHFEELERSECVQLLSAKLVGRVAVCGPRGPQVFPVNYSVHEGTILFRTTPYSQLANLASDARAAFEVDEVDEFLQSGWSVLVVGTATRVSDPDELPDNLSERPEPWAQGARTLFIRINPDEITGRRVHPS